MYEDYNEYIAFHYNAFRPALHAQILLSCLGERRFEQGLDVGCGTGQSSIALAPYCDSTIGIEPSKAMLEKVIGHPGVFYHLQSGDELPFNSCQFDLITFAGSWYYAQSQAFLDEVIRVSKPAAIIIVYDFDVSLRNLMMKMGIEPQFLGNMEYDLEADFSDLDQAGLEFRFKAHKSRFTPFKAWQIGHLLLAQRDNYELLSDLFGKALLYEKTVNRIQELEAATDIYLGANLYYTMYNRLNE
jgi:SAM-dependent methyltransferase